MMDAFRWWLAKMLNNLAWIICPEPERSRMERAWNSVKEDWIGEMVRQARKANKSAGVDV